VATTLVVSACTRLNPRTCTVLSTADSLQLSAAQSCSLEREWLLTLVVSSMHTPQSTHILFCPLQITAARQCSTVLRSLSVDSYDARLFQHAHASIHTHALLCPLQIHCSSAQHSLRSLEREWLRRSVPACTRLNPRTCIALSTADSLQLSAAQSWCSLEHDTDFVAQHTHPQPTHMHFLVHCRFHRGL
jgi:hypothetical protein